MLFVVVWTSVIVDGLHVIFWVDGKSLIWVLHVKSWNRFSLYCAFKSFFFAVMNEALVFYPAHRNRTNASTESTCWRYCLVRQRFQNGKRDECISLFLYISLCLSFAHLCTIQLYKRRKYFGREDFLSTGHIPVLFENRRWCPIL